MTSSLILGLTGDRGVGKSTICAHLLETYGFSYVHAFSGGKAAARAYYMHLGADADTAMRMTDGDLKEAPSPFLPGQASSRYFMEKFGKFLGTTLGPGWTLGSEIDLAMKTSDRILADSVVYEADVLKSRGGVLLKITRPQAGANGIDAPETTEAVARLVPDYSFTNDFDSVGEMLPALDELMARIMADHAQTAA